MAVLSFNVRTIYSSIPQAIGAITLFICIALAESLIASLKAETKKYRAFRAQFLMIVQVLLLIAIRFIWVRVNVNKWSGQFCKYYLPTILRYLLILYFSLVQVAFIIGTWLMTNDKNYYNRSMCFIISLCLGSFFCLLCLVIFIDLINYFNLWHHSQELRLSNNSKWRVLTTITVFLCITCVIVFTLSRSPYIQTVNVSLRRFRRGQQGMVIAHLCNIHLGPNIDQSYLQSIVETTNSVHPDFIFLNGELFNHDVNQLIPLLQPLKHLRARQGIYYSTGLQKSKSSDVDSWINALKSIGITTLNNQRIQIKYHANKLNQFYLAGLDLPEKFYTK
ncbi:uncharacterized protein TRIADDRAFT_55678 [Trichoplax adhaerens]|uniref:Calcineurin-like phosphoesterase domain-containing protein n=1 Tax=Trichoplax adhaerens TaxID=10228 RepID=B3RVJ7_TRIAD|nr:hypothetical protein TRIADDRAFT_55678 [Trichoplax adhaerens]EDV25512.1 hypothetical protein TRIADDRAFT_55678 [Trichoplax adhaerens]|eukprot:XP_002111545.1 hypothetical protein TRIADDRAFT_55678 [Trichoplax adhaerens]